MFETGQKKNMLIFILVAITIIVVLNTTVFPSLFSDQAEGRGNLQRVSRSYRLRRYKRSAGEDDYIFLLTGDEDTVSTVRMSDEALVDRLIDSGARFRQVAPAERPSQRNNHTSSHCIFVLVWKFFLSKIISKGSATTWTWQIECPYLCQKRTELQIL